MSEDTLQQDKKDKKSPKKGGWIVPTVTTFIGVFFSLAIAWYQINLSNEQALQAESERAKAVKNELILIVEEHVINQKVLDVSRLNRLSELRAKQEKLLYVPTVSEIVETAEYNILRSQYLDFEKKEQYKGIFDKIYSTIYVTPLNEYRGLFGNSVNELYASIQQGSTKESLEKLNKVLADFNSQITELESVKTTKARNVLEEAVKVIIEKPQFFIVAMMIYASILSFWLYLKRKKRTRSSLMYEFDDDLMSDDFDRQMNAELKKKFRESMRR